MKKYDLIYAHWCLGYLKDPDLFDFLIKCRDSLIHGVNESRGLMILKESICLDHEEPYEEGGDQRKILRSKQWYKDTFLQYGFNVKLSKFHDRRKDDYNDEMLFCLEPIQFLPLKNQLKHKINLDAVLIDGETKRICSQCYKKQRTLIHDNDILFNDHPAPQILYSPLE